MPQQVSRTLVGVGATLMVTATLAAIHGQGRATLGAEVRIDTPPAALAGSDGATHLAYELVVTNVVGTGSARLESVEVFGELDPKPLVAYGGNDLDGRVMRPGMEPSQRYGRLVPGGATAVVHIWATLPRGRAVPKYLWHRFVVRADDDSEIPVGEKQVSVSPEPLLVVGSPLREGPWFAHNGPGNHRSAHWGSVLLEKGQAAIPQRFAIDFMRLNASGRAVQGELQKSGNDDWFGFGAEVVAVADGVVRGMRDGIADNPALVEPPRPTSMSAEATYGNFVILALDSQTYVHYAHLQRSSVSVKVGQRVRRGQLLGRLGNSGNTNAPHLHFNITNSAAPEGSEGLPFSCPPPRSYGAGC